MSQNIPKKRKFYQDGINALPDDLLIQILSQLQTRDAVKTMLLSKRWRFLWTVIPKLDYRESRNGKTSASHFLDKSLQLHKAPLLQKLIIHIEQPHPLHVGKWVLYAVERGIQEVNLDFEFRDNPISLPISLYTCKTLVQLSLFRKICVDVPYAACLPSLKYLYLIFVDYRDQDSHVRLLSSCPVLKVLSVHRRSYDNVTEFSVNVPTLERLTYVQTFGSDKSLVIDSPGLQYLNIFYGPFGGCWWIPSLTKAVVGPNIEAFSYVRFLCLTDIACCSAINFPRLIDLKLHLHHHLENWLEQLMLLLQNSPKLKALQIQVFSEINLLSWNQPSSVPVCLSSHLEIFEWERFGGKSEEKQCVAYILANSSSLQTVRITPTHLCSIEEKHKMREDLESMYRVSASPQLVF